MTLGPITLSFVVASCATVLAALVGGGVALLLAHGRFRGRELLDALSTAPLVLPPTVLGYYLLVALGRTSPLGRLYERITGGTIVFSIAGAIVAATVGCLPLVVKNARAAFEAVDPTLIQAARTLGASRARAFYTVELPLAARGLVAALMLAFARALGDFGITLMVAGDLPGRTQTAPLAIYDALQAGDERQALALALTLTAIAMAALYAVNRLTRRSSVR